MPRQRPDQIPRLPIPKADRLRLARGRKHAPIGTVHRRQHLQIVPALQYNLRPRREAGERKQRGNAVEKAPQVIADAGMHFLKKSEENRLCRSLPHWVGSDPRTSPAAQQAKPCIWNHAPELQIPGVRS